MALRLIGEALDEKPDPEEVAELRVVEAGARRDLGEAAAARIVLEDALGGRPRPEGLDPSDAGRLRMAVAYADLLRAEGQEDLAERWTAAVAEVAPDLVPDADERLGVVFGEEDVEPEDQPGAGPEADELPESEAGSRSFQEEVEAEVAELLGEDEPPQH